MKLGTLADYRFYTAILTVVHISPDTKEMVVVLSHKRDGGVGKGERHREF